MFDKHPSTHRGYPRPALDSAIDVRPLRRGEEAEWHRRIGHPSVDELSAALAAGEERFHVARCGPRWVGFLAGVRRGASFRVHALRAAHGSARNALILALSRLGPSEIRTGDPELAAALRLHGFRQSGCEVLVGRSLRADLPPAPARLTLRPAREGFGELVRRVLVGAPGRADVARLCGARPDGVEAELGGRPAGVMLPERDGVVGWLALVGLVPEVRGRGLGRELHAAGLAELRRRGATVYRDRTDENNLPMLRVFAANGCEVDGVEHGFIHDGVQP